MPTRTLFYHYQVGHCSEPARPPFVAGSELVRVRVDLEPFDRRMALLEVHTLKEVHRLL